MSAGDQRLQVNWPACRARGFCHELLPEVVDLDEWGYPVVTGDVTASLLEEARLAVRSCPTLALRLTPVPEGSRPLRRRAVG